VDQKQAVLSTYQAIAGLMAPSRCSLKKTRVVVKARHLGSRMEGSPRVVGRTADVDRAASWTLAAGTRSARGRMEQPRLAHVQLQQTCGVDARQHTIASGSCCCTPRGDSRSFPGFRTERIGATAHSQADVRSVPERVS
jgi:hypothetical protein